MGKEDHKECCRRQIELVGQWWLEEWTTRGREVEVGEGAPGFEPFEATISKIEAYQCPQDAEASI
jgi:hypothetical protein